MTPQDAQSDFKHIILYNTLYYIKLFKSLAKLASWKEYYNSLLNRRAPQVSAELSAAVATAYPDARINCQSSLFSRRRLPRYLGSSPTKPLAAAICTLFAC